MKTQSMDGSIVIVIPSDLKEARRLQQRIERQLEATSFDSREIFGIRLALEEALVNAIKHGNRLDPKKKVKVRYNVQSHRFEIHITDEGSGFNPHQVPDCKAEENLTRPSGRGLMLMKHYMSEVVIHEPGNQLFMAKNRGIGGMVEEGR